MEMHHSSCTLPESSRRSVMFVEKMDSDRTGLAASCNWLIGMVCKDEKRLNLTGRFRIPFFMSSECESLIRRILVLDPTRRYSLQQILSHPWMQAEVPPTPPLHQVQPMAEVGTINEQILRLMQSLGIDPARTKEAIIKDAYDHHAATYFLLLDRLKEQKNSIGKGQTDEKRRRPSTVAEQPLKGMPGAEDFQSLHLRTTSETTLSDLHRIHLAHHGPSVPIQLGPTNTLVVANGFHPTRACKIPPG